MKACGQVSPGIVVPWPVVEERLSQLEGALVARFRIGQTLRGAEEEAEALERLGQGLAIPAGPRILRRQRFQDRQGASVTLLRLRRPAQFCLDVAGPQGRPPPFVPHLRVTALRRASSS